MIERSLTMDSEKLNRYREYIDNNLNKVNIKCRFWIVEPEYTPDRKVVGYIVSDHEIAGELFKSANIKSKSTFEGGFDLIYTDGLTDLPYFVLNEVIE